ncbi:hypothetical protein ACFYYN_15035 [Streptomyces sp. NPDC001902]
MCVEPVPEYRWQRMGFQFDGRLYRGAATERREPVVHTLLWSEEIREPDDLSSAAPVTEREREFAELLMDQLAGVNSGEPHDDYAAALE